MTMTAPRVRTSGRTDEVAERFEAFFRQKERLAAAYGRNFVELWAVMRRSNDGGKRFRPALVVNAYHALGGDGDEEVIVVATAFELLHAAFLLHDDVIDGDTVRRGRPNVAGAFSALASDQGLGTPAAARWGEGSAILAGDLLIHSAQAMVARLRIGEGIRTALLDLLEECMFITAAGELADISFSTGVELPVLSQVVSMAQWKTAHYSFQAPLQAGAILAGASQETLAVLGEYGRNVGIAFQLRDDILGIFGSSELMGKSTTSDIREGKVTPLMCYALRRSETSELADILHRGEASDADAARVREILEALGARSFIEQLMDRHTRAAMTAIESPAIPRALREQLAEVASKARQRSS